MSFVGWIVLLLVLAKWAWQIWLERLNRAHALQHADHVPEAFSGVMEPSTYAKAVEYTLARGRFHQWELSYATVVLLIVLFSGVLPLTFEWVRFGESAWAMAGFLFATGVALSLPSLPLDWYHQFRLEERFGFNTTTVRTWWLDRVKGLLLATLLGIRC